MEWKEDRKKEREERKPGRIEERKERMRERRQLTIKEWKERKEGVENESGRHCRGTDAWMDKLMQIQMNG